MITVNDLTYRYPHSRGYVLREVNFSLQPGEIVTLVGQNGSGKSTLGKLLAGIIKPARKQILINDLDVAKKSNYDAIFQKVGIVFQNPENQILFNNVYDEMMFAARNIKNPIAQIQAALRTVDMLQYLHSDLTHFSLGQKQRIILAETLVRSPEYLILDEPTTMLDSAGKVAIYQVLKQLRTQGIGILLVTNLAEELLLADRIFILAREKLVANITAQELLHQTATLEKYHIILPQLLQLVKSLEDGGMVFENISYTPDKLAKEILNARI